jgi:hypothetical protein
MSRVRNLAPGACLLGGFRFLPDEVAQGRRPREGVHDPRRSESVHPLRMKHVPPLMACELRTSACEERKPSAMRLSAISVRDSKYSGALMNRLSLVGLALGALAAIPPIAAGQKPPTDREKINTTIETPVDNTLTTCLGRVRIVGTLETTIKAGGAVGGHVHSNISSRLRDVTAVNVETGQEYKVQFIEHSHRSYEYGGTTQHVAGTTNRLRISAPGTGDSFVVKGRWQYRQDQAGNVVVNELEIDEGCK